MTNINGRKAVITNRLQRWSSFEALANQLGYPDAAVPSGQDKRTRPEDGDVVTVLSSVGKRGETVTRGNQRVFIVEAANGERHIYGEKGLRILDEKVTGVTVLKDENLGGVEREYREVKRKAVVGERIKVVDEDCGYEVGRIFTVTDADFDWGGVGRHRDGTGVGVDGDVPLFHERYLALEPTEIVRSNGARFRMVDRKAAVGERVIVVNPDYDADEHGDYTTGDTAIITSSNTDSYDVYYLAEKSAGKEITVYAKEYRVLEPVESAEPLSAKPAPDQAAEIIAALTTRVAALEKRIDALVSGAKPIPRSVVNPAQHPSFTKCAIKSPQDIRDDIVKRAKEDVERLVDDCLEAARVG